MTDRFCVNCKHHRPPTSAKGIHICTGYRSVVTGEPTQMWCKDMHQPDHGCGPAGRLYEPKEASATKVIAWGAEDMAMATSFLAQVEGA